MATSIIILWFILIAKKVSIDVIRMTCEKKKKISEIYPNVVRPINNIMAKRSIFFKSQWILKKKICFARPVQMILYALLSSIHASYRPRLNEEKKEKRNYLCTNTALTNNNNIRNNFLNFLFGDILFSAFHRRLRKKIKNHPKWKSNTNNKWTEKRNDRRRKEVEENLCVPGNNIAYC